MRVILNSFILINILVILLMAVSQSTQVFPYLIALPISTLIFNFIFKNKLEIYKNSLVVVIILVQIFIRYVILPFFMFYDSQPLKILGNQFYQSEAIFIMLIELLAIYMVMAVNARKFINIKKSSNQRFRFIKYNFLLFILLVLSILFIYSSGYFSRINYIWDLGDYIENRYELEEVSSFAAVLFYPTRMILSLLVISYIYNKNLKKSTKIIGIFLIIILNSIIIIGSSRFSILIAVLPLLSIIYILFHQFRKIITIGFATTILIVISLTTINKFAHKSVTSESSLVSANSLNAYFSGPGAQSKGIELYYSDSNWDRLNFLITDLFQNVPILSKLAAEKYKTNIYYNEAIYGHRLYQDQIVPLSLNGLIHFGTIGPIIYPIFFIGLSLYFERRFIATSQIGFKLIYISIGISLSLIFMNNIGSLTASIFRNILFLGIPIFLIIKAQNLLKKNEQY